ncbi:hypothetical protein [Streptomyces albipurpureus]|uniref:Uncharacterized protein n=1 Tax=Streptomyces albipurpureus TaxID=2897419 RepID=A0ABT0UGC6_9ACTN|nr:hypothetical protein [Streptomyces sp. CWNU-1]MCM2387687.1 hypothetical protein [Streptomyces sp. CWNU-1]
MPWTRPFASAVERGPEGIRGQRSARCPHPLDVLPPRDRQEVGQPERDERMRIGGLRSPDVRHPGRAGEPGARKRVVAPLWGMKYRDLIHKEDNPAPGARPSSDGEMGPDGDALAG